jgi:hypothetical protein
MAVKRTRLPYPAAVSDLLSVAFQGTPAERRLREGKVWLVWESAVGRQIAERARPVNFRDGTLTVAVSSAPWMQQLNFLKKGILEKLNALLGEELVREIHLKAGNTDRAVPPAAPEKRPKRRLSPEERQKIARSTDPVSDPDLRQALAELLERHLETPPS